MNIGDKIELKRSAVVNLDALIDGIDENGQIVSASHDDLAKRIPTDIKITGTIVGFDLACANHEIPTEVDGNMLVIFDNDPKKIKYGLYKEEVELLPPPVKADNRLMVEIETVIGTAVSTAFSIAESSANFDENSFTQIFKFKNGDNLHIQVRLEPGK